MPRGGGIPAAILRTARSSLLHRACAPPRPPAPLMAVGSLLNLPRPMPLHGRAVRSLSTEADKVGPGGSSDTLLSSVFGSGAASAVTATAALDDEAGADRHRNRNPKSSTMKEGKKTLKPWSGGKGGTRENQHFMEVQTDHVKILIGKRGEKMHSMMEESGAKIFISNKPGQDSSTRKMAITGPAAAVEKAKALVEAQIHFAKTAAVLAQTVQIPLNQTGLVIGKAGATIKAIEAETGAMVNIDSRQASTRRTGEAPLLRAPVWQWSRTPTPMAMGRKRGDRARLEIVCRYCPVATSSISLCACVCVIMPWHDEGAREAQKPAQEFRAQGLGF
jgi:hypothetical protein